LFPARRHFSPEITTKKKKATSGRSDRRRQYLRANVLYDAVDLVVGKQVRYLTAGQHVVDEHQKPFVGHLAVGQQKHDAHVLQAGLRVQRGQISPQVGDAVCGPELYLERFQGGYKRGQPGQRLFPTAAHAHEQRVTPGQLQYAIDPAYVRHRVLEQH